MPDTAQAQVQRLVELVAWLSHRDTGKPVPYGAAARQLGVPETTLRHDLDVLLGLSGEHKDWLASLRVALLADGFVVQSLGAFRRPVHFTGDEGVALLLGLASVRGGRPLAGKFARSLRGAPPAEKVESAYAIGTAPTPELENILALARRARDERRKMETLYCGLAGEPAWRVVHPHQLVEAAGRWYVVAWCETVAAFRHFRADRVLEARLSSQEFTPQAAFRPVSRPADLLRADETVRATVSFSARIARWLKERYPGGRAEPDGGYVVTFTVADPAWLVREVLQYGAEAEVIGPESLRLAVRAMVGAGEAVS